MPIDLWNNCLNFRKDFIIIEMQEMNYLIRDEGSFQQLKTNNFLVYIQGPTKLTHNFTIYNILNSSPISHLIKSTTQAHVKHFPLLISLLSFSDLIMK